MADINTGPDISNETGPVSTPAGASSGTLGKTEIEFELLGENQWFAPFYPPMEPEVEKERNLSKSDSICEGQDVDDIGAKNRTITLDGYLHQYEVDNFNRLLDYGKELDMIWMSWSGEVLVETGSVRGPVAISSETGDWLYRYTLSLVSTGTDEYGIPDDGIVSRGDAADDTTISDDYNPGYGFYG
ncbi:hypothetical protein [Halorubellus litoreus]|uniref:Uncharacterized protein n=1 Tax=Halorubellus litoreus TaxID=755308 RepID=A0ABD5VE43_9EURY